MIKLKSEHDHRIRCWYLGQIDKERPEISSICLILWMYQSIKLELQLAVLMRLTLFVVVLWIHLFELAMYFHLLFAVTLSLCIGPLVKWVIAVQSLERFRVNQVFELEMTQIHNKKDILTTYEPFLG